MAAAPPKIVLYTNHGCPWAHRAHIALAELQLPFEEHIIDLSTPRSAEYLAINPRGLVPTINYNGEIITESGVVAQFLADQHPSHLVKPSNEAGGALQRARIGFFVDAFVSKVLPHFMASVLSKTPEERDAAAVTLVAAVEKELEPHLGDAAPFFGGSSRLTLAEVQLGSFILRIWDFPSHDLISPQIFSLMDASAPRSLAWFRAVVAEKSVNHIWDAEKTATLTKAKLAQMAAAKSG